MRSKMKRKLALVATAALLVLVALPGTALADHDTPSGEGLIEAFPLECDGVTVTPTVTPHEFETPNSLGPGWLPGIGMAIPRSLTILDADDNVVLVQTNGKKTAKGLETITCTGPAVIGGQLLSAVFEFVVLP